MSSISNILNHIHQLVAPVTRKKESTMVGFSNFYYDSNGFGVVVDHKTVKPLFFLTRATDQNKASDDSGLSMVFGNTS